VFDKTGTISSPDALNLSFTGEVNTHDKILIASLARNSMHPLSREIVRWLNINDLRGVVDYREIAGKGIAGFVDGREIRIGSSVFVGSDEETKENSSTVHVAIDGDYKGFFQMKQQWRTGLKTLISKLKDKFDFHLISGDNDNDRGALTEIFPEGSSISFTQSPQHKLEYIKRLQGTGNMVMMLGDGLNDAGALKQSNLGVAVTDDINNFTPGCDAILDGASFQKLPQFIRQSKEAIKTIKRSFMISASYNLIGVYFAVQGTLSPLTAAVLMPISTITIITFTSLATHYYARKNSLK
jgi:Cu+-exporting ATPase